MKSWRPREDRRSVRFGVRVRTDAGWIDATVRNVSSRGLMLHTLQPLRRNQVVEIARGRSRVVGRVMWSDDALCGLQSQDRIDIDGLLAKADASAAPAGKLEQERRADPGRHTATIELQADGARLMGQAFERAALFGAIVCGAALAATTAYDAMATPLEQVQIAISSGSTPG